MIHPILYNDRNCHRTCRLYFPPDPRNRRWSYKNRRPDLLNRACRSHPGRFRPYYSRNSLCIRQNCRWGRISRSGRYDSRHNLKIVRILSTGCHLLRCICPICSPNHRRTDDCCHSCRPHSLLWRMCHLKDRHSSRTLNCRNTRVWNREHCRPFHSNRHRIRRERRCQGLLQYTGTFGS